MNMGDIDALEELVSQWPQDQRLESLNQERERRLNFFYQLVKLKKPELCLEIGCFRATVSAYMCAAAEEYGGHVVAIDNVTEHIPRYVLPELFDNFHYILKDSCKAGPDVEDLVKQFGHIGIVWQDSSHLYKQSVIEWNIYSQLLDKEAIWVCDDLNTHYPEDVNTPRLWGYWAERPGKEKKIYREPSPFRNGANIGVLLLDRAKIKETKE